MICLGEQARVNPGPTPPPHRTGGRPQGTEGQLPLSSSLASMSARATTSTYHQGDSKDLHKEETERQHERTELKEHKTDRSVTESRHTHDNGIRSQKETVVFDNSFMLHPAAKRNRSHHGRCAAQEEQVKPDRPHRI